MITPSVLLVDPDADFARVLSALLVARGLHVRYTTRGREALAWCRRAAPAVLVTELELPDLDGMELVAAARALGDAPRIVVLTQLEGARRFDGPVRVALGADAVLVRPLTFDAVAESILATTARHERAAHSARGSRP